MSGSLADRLRRTNKTKMFYRDGEGFELVARPVPASRLFAEGVTPPMFAMIFGLGAGADTEPGAKLSGADLAKLIRAAVKSGLVCPKIESVPGEIAERKCGLGHEGCVLTLDDLGELEAPVGLWILSLSGYSVEAAAVASFRGGEGDRAGATDTREGDG